MNLRLGFKVATALTLAVWMAATPVAGAEKQPVTLSELGNRDRLAALLYRYSSSKIDSVHLDFWVQQLDNAESFKNDGSLPPKLAVREIALTCLEAMTGTEFSLQSYGKRREVREIITHRKGDAAWRYQIGAVADQQSAQIKAAASFWVQGFKRGVAETGRQTVTRR